MTAYVKLVANADSTTSSGARRLEMVAPVDQAWEALWALASQLPPSFTFTAVPVDDIGLRSERAVTDTPT